jgi:hypothetical protein
VEAVRASANGHAQLTVLLGGDQPLWHREGVGERGQRRRQRSGHALALPTFGRALHCDDHKWPLTWLHGMMQSHPAPDEAGIIWTAWEEPDQN